MYIERVNYDDQFYLFPVLAIHFTSKVGKYIRFGWFWWTWTIVWRPK